MLNQIDANQILILRNIHFDVNLSSMLISWSRCLFRSIIYKDAVFINVICEWLLIKYNLFKDSYCHMLDTQNV